MEFILLVTWFLVDQPPTSYQVRFGSSGACAQARFELKQEETRFKAEAKSEKAEDEDSPVAAAPRLSALCVPFN